MEAQMATDQTLNHEYLPVAGLVDYRNAAAKLLLGPNCEGMVQNRVRQGHTVILHHAG